MSTETERFLGIDDDPSGEQDKAGPTTKWWLASLLLPIAAIGAGVYFAFFDRSGDHDLFRGIIYCALSILIGSILSLVSAIVSFVLRERKAPFSLLLALPSLAVLIFAGCIAARIPYERKQSEKAEQEYRKQETERSLQIANWTKEFKANPELITSDEFWSKHNPPDTTINYALLRVISDPSFVTTPEVRRYIIEHFPEHSRSVLAFGRSSTAELETYANGTNSAAAEVALETLMRDKSFEFTDHYRQLTLKQYPQLKEHVFNFGFFTKTELEQMISNPETQSSDKLLAERALRAYPKTY